jgi:hypothetical protein
MSLAQAKAEQVLEIVGDLTVTASEHRFDIHDARWCIKILAEAIVALCPEEPS